MEFRLSRYVDKDGQPATEFIDIITIVSANANGVMNGILEAFKG